MYINRFYRKSSAKGVIYSWVFRRKEMKLLLVWVQRVENQVVIENGRRQNEIK